MMLSKRLVVLGCALLVSSVSCSSKTDTSPASPMSATDEVLIAKARGIVTAVDEARWQDARKDFDTAMRKALPSALLATSWSAYRKEFGDFESQGNADVVESRTGLKVVNIALDMSKQKGQARVTFDKRGKVAGLFFLKTGVPVP